MKNYKYIAVNGVIEYIEIDGVRKEISQNVAEYFKAKELLTNKYSTKVEDKEDTYSMTDKQDRKLHKELVTLIGNEKTKQALKELKTLGIKSIPKMISFKIDFRIFKKDIKKDILIFI